MGILDRLKQIAHKKDELPPVVLQIRPKIRKYGTHGRIEIPELGISVPLYDSVNGNSQELCDNADSAVCMKWSSQIAIADHCNQGNFSNLNKARVGRTIATIDQQDKKEHYRCVRSQIGHIRISESGNRIFDSNWAPAYKQNAGGLCIYTCIEKSAPDVMDVRLTYWQPLTVISSVMKEQAEQT